MSSKLDALTPRQREVAMLVAQGLTNKQIAEELHISESTVKNHVTSAFDNTGVYKRAGLKALVLESKSL